MQGVDVDVSINDSGGVEASALMRRHLHELPALRPLALTLKALLRAHELGDVSRGGLGSYALVNAIIAHLQEEQKV